MNGGAWLFECEGCRAARRLFAVVRGRLLCAACWKAAGAPYLRGNDPLQAFAQEQETRQRMLARGGTDRHLARAGKA